MSDHFPKPPPVRDGLGRWQPGSSGNPAGKFRKDYITRALEKELEADSSIEGKTKAQLVAQRLVEIATGESSFDVKMARAAVQAAKEIADRVEGKAIQKVELDAGASVGDLIQQAWSAVAGGEKLESE